MDHSSEFKSASTPKPQHACCSRHLQSSEPAIEGAIYTCPMHPEIRQDHPGNCPKCGMALEPEMPSLDESENPELVDFRRRFWITLPFTIAVFVLAMFGHQLDLFAPITQSWIEFLLAVPV